MIFVSASHQTGFDTQLMTQRSIIEGLGEGKVGNESKLELCKTLVVIGQVSAMWARWA